MPILPYALSTLLLVQPDRSLNGLRPGGAFPHLGELPVAEGGKTGVCRADCRRVGTGRE
jgi:hypothetical protein